VSNDPSLIPPPSAKDYLVTTPADRNTVRIQADKLSFGGFHFKDVDLTLNIEKPGLLGLDAGASVINTWYYPHLLTDAKGTRLSGVLSTNAIAPSPQTGYTVTWRGGCVYNNAAGDFYRVLHDGVTWEFDEITNVAPFRILNVVPGVGPVWTVLPALTLQPPALYGGRVLLFSKHLCNCVGDDWLAVRPNGSNWIFDGHMIIRVRSIAVGVQDVGLTTIPTDANGQIQWANAHAAGGSSISVDIRGHEDNLFQ